MKRLGMLLVLVSVSMFALGCGEQKKAAPKDDGKAGAAVEKKADAPPADAKAADTKKEEKK